MRECKIKVESLYAKNSYMPDFLAVLGVQAYSYDFLI